MERNTLTTADCLSKGDRFFKANDKKKEPFTVVNTNYTKNTIQVKGETGRFNSELRKNTQVVYLRNIEE